MRIRSESTRFFGQPSETKPTFGGLVSARVEVRGVCVGDLLICSTGRDRVKVIASRAEWPMRVIKNRAFYLTEDSVVSRDFIAVQTAE